MDGDIGCLQMKKALQQAFKVVISGSEVWVNFASRMSKSAAAEVSLFFTLVRQTLRELYLSL